MCYLTMTSAALWASNFTLMKHSIYICWSDSKGIYILSLRSSYVFLTRFFSQNTHRANLYPSELLTVFSSTFFYHHPGLPEWCIFHIHSIYLFYAQDISII